MSDMNWGVMSFRVKLWVNRQATGSNLQCRLTDRLLGKPDPRGRRVRRHPSHQVSRRLIRNESSPRPAAANRA
jgi:hypothetical protein